MFLQHIFYSTFVLLQDIAVFLQVMGLFLQHIFYSTFVLLQDIAVFLQVVGSFLPSRFPGAWPLFSKSRGCCANGFVQRARASATHGCTMLGHAISPAEPIVHKSCIVRSRLQLVPKTSSPQAARYQVTFTLEKQPSRLHL